MAGLNLGPALGAITQAQTALGSEKSLKDFLATMSKMGAQVKNNFEVNFSGIPDLTFFIQSITLPGMKQNMTSLWYNGREVFIPINHEYNHEFSMTVLNDAQGYIYSALNNFIMTDSTNLMVNSGYTMTVKAQNGNSDWPGMLLTLRGVRIETMDGLAFGQNDNDVSTFSIAGKIVDFTATPGAAAGAAGLLGAANSILG